MVPGFLIVVNGGREWLNMNPSSCTCGVKDLIRGRWGVWGFLVLDWVGPILDFSFLSFCFRGVVFLRHLALLEVGRRVSERYMSLGLGWGFSSCLYHI